MSDPVEAPPGESPAAEAPAPVEEPEIDASSGQKMTEEGEVSVCE